MLLQFVHFFLGFGPAQAWLDTGVLGPMRDEARRKGRDLEIKEYNRILAAEGLAKAQEFQRMPKVAVIYPAHLQFLENNKKAMSMLAISLVVLYFIVWLGIRGAVRYVVTRLNPDESPTNR